MMLETHLKLCVAEPYQSNNEKLLLLNKLLKIIFLKPQEEKASKKSSINFFLSWGGILYLLAYLSWPLRYSICYDFFFLRLL